MIRTCIMLSTLAAVSCAHAQTRLVATGYFGHAVGLSTGGTVQPIPALIGGHASIAAEGTTLYTGTHDGHLNAYDMRTMAPIGTGRWWSASNVADLAIAPGALFAVAAHEGSGTIHRLDPATLATLDERTTAFRPAAIAVAGGTVYIGGQSQHLLWGAAEGGPLAPFPGQFVAVDALAVLGDALYVAQADTMIARVNRHTGELLALVSINPCDGMVVDAGEVIIATQNLAWNFAPRVERYSAALDHILGHVMLPGQATDLAVAPLLACGPDINRDGVLSVSDFGAFQSAFVAGEPVANYNGDWVLSVQDFGAFQSAFATGCK